MNLALNQDFGQRVRRNEPMSKHTSWRAGGPAEIFFTPRDRDDLAAFLRTLPEGTPLMFVGLGSNLLVRDGGLRGAVVCTHGAFTRLERRSATEVYCEAGVPCARIARQCVNWQLGQGEFFAGIPGTLGGALAMNAGAYGGETWKQVVSVEAIDSQGKLHARAAAEYQPAYRHVGRPANDEWFLSAVLRFAPVVEGETQRVRELAERRKQTQPLGEWSCGSVFTNPPGDHAARLIETAGLKGHRIGDAEVSTKHANFILNRGHATAGELEQLVLHVQSRVFEVHGVKLEPEVKIVGEKH